MSGIKDLASKGRNGDNMLMHVSNDEVAGLNALAQSTMGRELTTNPETGLPEAFMFAPLLAPMVAGGVGLGTGAIATGLTAGALGAAEAELRGMDDPLRRGLYSGLTAGAASGIGNALSGAADAGAVAGSAGDAGAQAATTSGAPDLSQTVKAGPSAGNMQSVAQQSFPGSAYTPPPTAGQAMSNLGLSPSAPTQLTQPTTTAGSATLDPRQAFQQSQYADVPDMVQGAKNIFADEGARQQFMQQAKIPATAGFVGLGGQAQMNMQDKMKDRKEADEAESAAELKAAQDRIRANYASVGRPMPTGFGGSSLFAQGGIVNLRRGGGVGDGGGRAANNGGMGGGSSTGGSRGGGGGGGRSSHPGRPGGESGERSMSRSGGQGDGGAAVQAPQLDPAAIEAAVISPMDRLGQGIKSLAMMSPTVRALQHLTRDRRALGGSSGHGPGAPGAGDARPGQTGVADRGGAQAPILPMASSMSGPTLPLTATPTPTPNQTEFLAQLQQGAGNQAAMQRSGYGMASGGYLDGGMLPGDGMSDDVPASIDGNQPAALSSGEFVVPADVVSHIGNGSSDAGAKELYAMMDRIRQARTGREKQAPEVNAKKMLPK